MKITDKALDCASVKRNGRSVLQRPSHPARGEAEGGGLRDAEHLIRRDKGRDLLADPKVVRVAAGEHGHGWPRLARIAGKASCIGLGHGSRSPLMSRAASSRCRAPPTTNSAEATRPRASGESPSAPSWPMPIMDSQRPFVFSVLASILGPDHAHSYSWRYRGRFGAGEAYRGRQPLSAHFIPCRATASPAIPPIPYRIGGFGGWEGLAAWLKAEGVSAMVDATHPFAARISANAVRAAEATGVAFASLIRPAWTREDGDQWIAVPSPEAAAAALGPVPRTIFLATGRLELPAFVAAPQHSYIARVIDHPGDVALPPLIDFIYDRGPFDAAAEARLFKERRAEIVVSKNSGGAATYGKIEAARARTSGGHDRAPGQACASAYHRGVGDDALARIKQAVTPHPALSRKGRGSRRARCNGVPSPLAGEGQGEG